MKKQISIIIMSFTILATLSFLTTSCNKDEKLKNDNTSASADDALAEGLFDNATNIANEAYENGSGGLKTTNESLFVSGCAIVTLDLTVSPKELTIDFGNENCLCEDGRYRRGKILVTFNGEYWAPGTTITYGFEDYHVNDYKIDGTKVITNMGLNNEGNLYYSINVVGIITIPDNGGNISWNSQTEREWVEGNTTWTHLDDVYLITGVSNGIRSNGLTWSKVITNALRVEIGCRWIVSGTMEIQPEGVAIRTVDWGDGECDNIATVLVNGIIITIYLP